MKQEHCAMKVCTDACLFGAWVAEESQKPKAKNKKCLDIGSGTGLLALMLAQKLQEIKIDAVEIDRQAALEAKLNFENSLWKEQLSIFSSSIQEFKKTTAEKYDLIISNPPFFENDLKSVDQKRNLALHSEELSFHELLETVVTLLNDKGSFAVLIPFQRTDEFELLAKKKKMFLHKKMLVKQTPAHSPFRSMMIFSSDEIFHPVVKEIMIKNDEGSYSVEFKELLKDYYLYL